MMKKVVLATTNKGKVKEFKEMLAPLGVEIISSDQLGVEELPDVEENGTSFEENALIKAKAYYELFGYPALADDSGLAIDALEGRPGIYSARYAGEEKNDQANIDKVLEELQDVPGEKRAARFICAIAYVDGQQEIIVSGECEGLITHEPRGKHGFGYDPIFFVPSEGKTMAELPPEVKNRLSHRHQALQKLVQIFNEKPLD